MKSILVTGGAGFIGSNLALEVQNRFPEARIAVVDDFRSSSFKNLVGFRGEVVASSVAEKEWLDTVRDRPLDTIFHLASITDTTVLDEKKMIFDNVEGFRNVLELAREKKAAVVYASSAGVYGSGAVPVGGSGAVPGGAAGGGSQDAPMKEEDAGRPNNVYGFSKWVMDQLAFAYGVGATGRPPLPKIVGLRYFNVFGPGEGFKKSAASMIYQLYLQMAAGKRPRIFKWGEQRRDFIYVKDAVAAALRALEAKRNTVLNVGTGQSTSFNEVIDALNEGLGTNYEPDYFDNPYDFYQDFTQADMTRTRRELGFEAEFTTREGVLDYVRNYLLPAKQTTTTLT